MLGLVAWYILATTRLTSRFTMALCSGVNQVNSFSNRFKQLRRSIHTPYPSRIFYMSWSGGHISIFGVVLSSFSIWRLRVASEDWTAVETLYKDRRWRKRSRLCHQTIAKPGISLIIFSHATMEHSDWHFHGYRSGISKFWIRNRNLHLSCLAIVLI